MGQGVAQPLKCAGVMLGTMCSSEAPGVVCLHLPSVGVVYPLCLPALMVAVRGQQRVRLTHWCLLSCQVTGAPVQRPAECQSWFFRLLEGVASGS